MNQSIDLGLEDSYSEEEEDEIRIDNDNNQQEANGDTAANEETENQNDPEDGPGTTKTKSARKKVIRNPQPKLDAARLSSERGLPALPGIFCKLEWKGKKHVLSDLQKLMRYLEHWAHRLYPKLPFEDVLERIEQLGKKKEVRTCITKIRLDIPLLNSDVVDNDKNDEEEELTFTQPSELGITDTASNSVWDTLVKENANVMGNDFDREPLSHTPNTPVKTHLTEEQIKRMQENQRRAQELRVAKMQAKSNSLEIGNLSNTLQCIKVSSFSQDLVPEDVQCTSETAVVQVPETPGDSIKTLITMPIVIDKPDLTFNPKLSAEKTEVLVVDRSEMPISTKTSQEETLKVIVNKPEIFPNTETLEPQGSVEDELQVPFNTRNLEQQDTVILTVDSSKASINSKELEPQNPNTEINTIVANTDGSLKEENEMTNLKAQSMEWTECSDKIQYSQNDVDMVSVMSGPESMEIDS